MAGIDDITNKIEETKKSINELKNSDPKPDDYEQKRREIQTTINGIREELSSLSDEVDTETLEQQISDLEQEYNEAFIYTVESEGGDQGHDSSDNQGESDDETTGQGNSGLLQGVKNELKKNPVGRGAIIVGWGITLGAGIKALVKRFKRKKKEKEQQKESETPSGEVDNILDTVEKGKKTADGILDTVDRVKNIFGKGE